MRAMLVDKVKIYQRENSRGSDLTEAKEKDETSQYRVSICAEKATCFP
jgi:hypothetical protein